MNRTLAIGIGIVAAIGAAAASAALPASAWEIGPVIRGKNYSQGMPPSPQPTRTGWTFDFPFPNARAGHVHYVTFDPGSLAGKSKIVVRYRVDAAPGVRFVPQESPGEPATLSLMFQRRGDNWSARGRYNFYRWYSPVATLQPIRAGVGEMTISLTDPGWVAVQAGTLSGNERPFADALADASRVGLVFGSAGGRGHGVFSTAPARFTLISFDIR